MIKAKHIIAFLIIIGMFVYFRIGDAESFNWARYDFAMQSFMTMLMGVLLLRATRDVAIIISVKIFMGIAMFKLLFNAYGFIYVGVFNKVNNAYWTGGVICGCILIFLIYRSYGLVKK